MCVCVNQPVCWSRSLTLQTDQEFRLGAGSGWLKEQMEFRFLKEKRQFWGLFGPFKSTDSLRCVDRSKMGHSILNDGTTCDAAFRQNPLITCYNANEFLSASL